MMTPRENIIRALRRKNPEWVPWGMDLSESLKDKLREETGSDNFYEYFQLPYRYIDIKPTRSKNQYDMYYKNKLLKEGTEIDEWGVAHEPVGLAHFTEMIHPMADFTILEEIENFPLPDLLADYRWEGVKEQVEETKKEGLLAVYFAVQVFEPAWYLRGIENMLMDLYDESELAIVLLERICAIQEAFSRKLGECGYDMVVFGDDVGTQESLMMSKNIWKKYLKPVMRRCIMAAKDAKSDILAFYHSDGNVEELVEEFIDMGIDILNPVQPECMNPSVIKEKYGDRLSFWGTIGTQTTMPFGTEQEVRDTVKQRINEVGENGGLVLAPTHLLEPEVPMENIRAFYEAVQEYGKY